MKEEEKEKGAYSPPTPKVFLGLQLSDLNQSVPTVKEEIFVGI